MAKNKEKALEILVSGEYSSYEEVAQRLKISAKTLYNWRNEDEFADEYDRRIKIKIGGAAAKALRKQEKLLTSKNDMVAHLAAKDILDRAGFGADTGINIKSFSPVQIIDNIPGDVDDTAG